MATKSELAVADVLWSLRDDGRKAYLINNTTQTFALLTEAYAETNGLDVDKFRTDFWALCHPVGD